MRNLSVMLGILCLSLSFTCFSQDKILLMNGQEFDCKILSDTSVEVVFQVTKKNGKVKELARHKSDIFSYTYSNKPEKIIYVMDTMMGDFYSESEMRVYLAGERDARNNYHPRGTIIVGFLMCGAIAYWGGDGYITAVAPPIGYTVLQLIPKLKIREKTMSDVNYKYNDVYADGYEPPARSRKVLGAMGGSFAGSALGVTMWFIFHK